MNRIQCILFERTGRKYWRASSTTPYGHDACCSIHGERHRADGEWTEGDLADKPLNALGPEHCGCGFVFSIDDRQRSGSGVNEYRRADNGELLPLGDSFPVGAMWYGEWLEYDVMPNYGEESQDKPMPWWKGPDNRILQVMTPGGPWTVDGRASNCTMPEDNKHRCWVRHGEPPNVTVDKNGLTCNAGAGSIQCGSYHGFLRNGFLEGC